MDIDQRIDTLERRLSAVERKSRAWRILALLLLAALVGGATSEGVFDNASWAADEKDHKAGIVTTSITIVDKNGNHRGRWNYYAGLALFDAERKLRAQLTESRLNLRTADGKGRIDAHTVHHQSGLPKAAPQYRSTINVKCPPEQSPGANSATLSLLATGKLEVSDRRMQITNSRDVAELASLEQKKDALLDSGLSVPTELVKRMNDLYFSDGSILLSTTKKGSGAFAVSNPQGTPVVNIQDTPNGGGHIQVYNPLRAPAVTIQSNKSNEGGVYVSDVNGKVVRALEAP